MKYQAQLAEVARLLPTTANILVLLPSQPQIDDLAAGLAFFLSLKQAGKEAAVVTEGIIRVGHTNLFGVGEIQSKIPETHGGDFVLTLGGVATTGPDGKGIVPSLEKVDYYTAGSDLNLVFKLLPGQKFEPTSITPRYEGGGFNLVFIIGATTLSGLGSLASLNQQLFSSTHLVNIDCREDNTQFGTTNVVDPTSSSVSEMIPHTLASLGLPVNGDIATNILSGIFSATAGLQERNASADTFEVVAQVLRVGGQRPSPAPTAALGGAGSDRSAGAPPVVSFDLSKIFQAPSTVATDGLTGSPPVSGGAAETEPEPQPLDISSIPSPEERPAGEGVEVVTPEADWLTPKIFNFKGKGG